MDTFHVDSSDGTIRTYIVPSREKIDQCIDGLFNSLETNKKTIINLRNQVEELKRTLNDENRKDDEYRKLQDENDKLKAELHRGFQIDEDDYNGAIEWMTEHNEEIHKGTTAGAIGGRYTWQFVPTGIGVFGSVKCNCGAEYNFKNDF